jgi:sterol 3beta-glucosyltransferase
VLRVMINDNEHHQTPDHVGREAATPTAPDPTDIEPPGSPSNMPLIKENVRATLSPRSARHVGRASMSDASARSSVDAPRKSWDGRRSTDGSHAVLHTSHETRKSFRESRREPHPSNLPKDRSTSSQRVVDSESTTTSIEPGTESSAAIQSMDESNASASQILDRSDVFRAPAAHSHMPASDQAGLHVRSSHDTTRSSGAERQKQRQHPEKIPRKSSKATIPPDAPEVDDDAFSGQDSPRLSGSSSALQDIASYPLHKASGLAGFLRTRSKKMSSLLATESMGYYEKVSGMLAGGRKHYATAEGLEPDDQIHGLEDDEDANKAAENFREHFAFPDTEILQSSFFASLQRVLPNYGKIYVSTRYFCFRSLMPTSKTKV